MRVASLPFYFSARSWYHIVNSVPTRTSSSRARRLRIAGDEIMRICKMPWELVMWLTWLSDSLLYELGTVYLQLCDELYQVENRNYEELVDPSIFIPRFTNSLLKGTHDKAQNVMVTARDIIASMKRDWMQTGRKPSGICGAAIYIAAISHGIMCSRTDIGKIVHMCEATITKRLIEFANTDAAKLNVDELTERERILHKETLLTPRQDSDKREVICEHKGLEHFGYGLCKNCYKDFIKISGGVVGGSDPPAFQRAEKERIEKAAREENEGGIEKSEGETDWDAEALDESGNLSDLDGDKEVDNCLNDEEEMRMKTTYFDLEYGEYLKEKAASEAFNVSNANCPEYARNLVEASKASVAKSRKEKRQKRAEEAKNAPPPATTMEAVTRIECLRKG
ncbi:unnamed protein product [Arabis nemorensis]|uniref:Cyclin-like domain-containing protein n=1 Tax=Arabis nemorensis TaxID=586526 RepID=A0A565CXQ8_9BRAS|nr:unnamed protein product [Arabis nemorensis]